MPPNSDQTHSEAVLPANPANSQATVGLDEKRASLGRPALPGYEILGELGRGGMGVVYRARQIALGREVALKMILAGAHAGAGDLSRFRSEAQAVASLRHPNIVQIYEVGEHEGRPFFSLEFMDGGSLSARLDGKPFSPHSSARLVEPLARAMQTAHEHGIVHRDLKPGNILLSGVQSPKSKVQSPKKGNRSGSGSASLDLALWTFKVGDFGLAKRLDNEDRQTRTGAVLGTPSYMAPEQAAGRKDVGPAADVYALGAILYDLLTGRPPFVGENELDTLIQVTTQEPVPPRRLQPKVPRDLETICLKCLQKQPQRRYGSAAELADDLARFLADRPIQARPIGSMGRVLKWTRRKPALAALVGVCFLAAIATVAGVFVHAIQLQEALAAATAARADADANARLARDEKEKAEQHSKRAAENFRRARAAVDLMLTRLAQEELASMPHMESLRETILTDALRYYEEFLKEKGDDPEVRQEAGRAYRRIGEIDHLLNKHSEARAAYAQAMALQEKLAADHPEEPAYRRDLAVSYHQRGDMWAALGEAKQAESDYAKVRELRIKLMEQNPGGSTVRLELASLCNSLGTLLQANGRMEEANLAFSEAHDLLVKEMNPPPTYRRQLALTLNNLGLLHRERSEPGKARDAYRKAIGLYERLRRENPTAPDYRLELARTHYNLGMLQRPSIKPANPADEKLALESEKAFTSAVDLCTQLAADFPKVPRYRQLLTTASLDLSILLRRCGQAMRANEACLKALEIGQKLALEFPGVPTYKQAFARSVASAAVALRDANQTDESRKYFEIAERLGRELVETYPKVPAYRHDLANTCAQLATLLRQTDLLTEARRFGELAVEMQRSALALNPSSPIFRRGLRNEYVGLAETLIRMNDLNGAADAAERIPMVLPKLVDSYLRATRLLCRCSNAARQAKQPKAATAFADRAMAMLLKARENGLKDADVLKQENFKVLLRRSDYQQLLAELEQESKGKK